MDSHVLDSLVSYAKLSDTLSTPCNGFEGYADAIVYTLSTPFFQLHVMDSLADGSGGAFIHGILSTPCNGFRLYNSDKRKGGTCNDCLSTPCNGFVEFTSDVQSVRHYHLSTPCNGFYTMGGVVLVYPTAITYFN